MIDVIIKRKMNYVTLRLTASRYLRRVLMVPRSTLSVVGIHTCVEERVREQVAG